jgi:pimeloyl-ACP methyl ester carboxylesterase
VVCPDVVGRGESDRLVHTQDYGFPQYVADMLTLIARLNVPQVHWVGTSMGGRIGMAVAALPDSPVQRLVINDIGPEMSREGLRHIATYLGEDPTFSCFEDAVAYVKAVSQGFGEHSDAEWRFLTEHCVLQTPEGRWQFRYDPAISPFYSTSARRSRMRRRMARQLIRFFPDHHPMLYQWPLYERITCPTLAIRGAESNLLRRQAWLQMGERGPRAQLVEIPGVGHAPTFLHADNIRIVSDFLLAA